MADWVQDGGPDLKAYANSPVANGLMQVGASAPDVRSGSQASLATDHLLPLQCVRPSLPGSRRQAPSRRDDFLDLDPAPFCSRAFHRVADGLHREPLTEIGIPGSNRPTLEQIGELIYEA